MVIIFISTKYGASMIIGGRGSILSMVLTKGNNFVLGWGVGGTVQCNYPWLYGGKKGSETCN